MNERDRWSDSADSVMSPGVIALADDATLGHVRQTLTHHGVDAALIVGRVNGMPLGWATTKGLLDHLDTDPWRKRAVDVITESPNVIHPSDSLRHAAIMLAAPNVTHLLVAGAGDRSFVGVVTARDLLRATRLPA